MIGPKLEAVYKHSDAIKDSIASMEAMTGFVLVVQLLTYVHDLCACVSVSFSCCCVLSYSVMHLPDRPPICLFAAAFLCLACVFQIPTVPRACSVLSMAALW